MKKIICLMILFLFINVKAEEDLKNVKVNGNLASCSGYECFIEIDSKDATITYEVGEHIKSSTPLSGHKISDIESEYNVHFELTVEDSDTPINYTLTIKRHEKSSDGSLSKLVINEEEVELKENVFVYSFDAKYNDEKIVVSGETNDSNAKAPKSEYAFPIENSSQTIEYYVEAEDGSKQKYTIVLKRKNKPDTSLKSLTINDEKIDLKENIYEYDLSVLYAVNVLSIEALPNIKDCKVEVIQEETLKVGDNVIKIVVTNEEAADTYIINVTRLENMDLSVANLESLTIKDYKLNFKADVYEYELLYGDIPEKLEIKAKAKDNDAEVIILNNENLQDGSVILVKSKLSDVVERIYKLKISLQEKVLNEKNNKLILGLIIALVCIMIVLFILQKKENKKKKIRKIGKEVSEIEII